MKKVAIVTGASRGIGRAIAVRLAREGFAVVVNYVHHPREAEKAVCEIKEEGKVAIAVQADVSKPTDVARLFDLAEHTFGGVDVLVNNAGIMPAKSIVEMESGLFERTFAVNVRGTFNTLKLAAERLRRGGRIVNMSSAAVAFGLPKYAVYNASKAAVDALTKTLAAEFRGRDITLNAVAPGPTATDLFFDEKSDEHVIDFASRSPMDRLGTPEDIANIVAFLTGPEGGWINGQTIRSTGGLE